MTFIYDGLTKEEVLELPTIHTSQFDDLKREDVSINEHVRVWVSRCEESPDGLPLVTIEKLDNGIWEVDSFY